MNLNTFTKKILRCGSLIMLPKTLIFILFLNFTATGQDNATDLLIKKWFYCGDNLEPSTAETVFFYSSQNGCKNDWNPFYWEFTTNGEYRWSEIIHYDFTEIDAGVIVVPNDNWRLEGELLYLDSNVFRIDVLNETNLLIHREQE